MELIFAFCISVFFVSSRGMEVSNSVRKYNTQSCRFCSNHCNKPHDGSSENDTVKVFKPADRANTIFCLSPYEMKLVVGVESNRIARTYSQIPSPSKLGATLGQHTLNVSSTQRLFCLGLTVKDYQLSSKTGLVYYAMCKATESDVSSRWYKIDKGFHFYPGKLKFNAIDQREFRVNVTKFTLTTTPARASFSPTIESSPPKPEDSTIIGPATGTPNQMNESTTDHSNSSRSSNESAKRSIRNDTEPSDNLNGTDASHFPKTTVPSNAINITDSNIIGYSSDPTDPVATQDVDTTKYIIYGVGGGAVAIVFLLLTLVVILMKKVKRQEKKLEITAEEIDEFMLGIAAEKANAKGINGLFVLPYDPKLEIPKSDVTIRSTVLGSGAFGQVVKGIYHGNPVAIKMLKNNASQNADYLRSLLGELKVMSYLGSHPNLVKLLGAMTAKIKAGEVYLVFEFCSKGNAHKFVRAQREHFVDISAGPAPSGRISMRIGARSSRISRFYDTMHGRVCLSTKELVKWAHEVASGMEFVSSKNVYHGDLAARNILLMEDLTAKVGDFGLSKQLDMEKYNCYVQKKECPLPLKWMAIESLRDLTFSIRSDVWSYGVTLCEFFTLGATPYPGMDWNFESWKLLCEGKRLGKPDHSSDAIYDIMMKCWDADPRSRPRFAELRDSFHRELQKF